MATGKYRDQLSKLMSYFCINVKLITEQKTVCSVQIKTDFYETSENN